MADKRIKMNPMRRFIHKKLKESVNNYPQVTGFTQVDVTELMEYKKELSDKGIKITVTGFIVRAIVQALSEYKYLNARMEEDGYYTIYEKINPSIALNFNNGLYTPVILDAESKGAREISEEIKGFMSKLQAGTMTPDDMKGGTITISSIGQCNCQFFTSVINNDECLIMGFGGVRKTPMVLDDDTIAVRQAMWFCTNSNHSLADGMQVLPFTERLYEILEHPRENIEL